MVAVGWYLVLGRRAATFPPCHHEEAKAILIALATW
jgi:hypothetical protein